MAALDGLLNNHPEWNGLVQGLMINQSGVAYSIADKCALQTELPVLQDDAGSPMWSALATVYNSLLIIDQDGLAAQYFEPIALPADNAEVEAAVNGLLGL